MLELFSSGSLIVKLVLILLLSLSVLSWAIIVLKHRQFTGMAKENAQFWALTQKNGDLDWQYRSSTKLKKSNLAALAKEACYLLDQQGFFQEKHPHPEAEFSFKDQLKADLNRSTREFIDQEVRRLEEGLIYLATIGSTAPFIGLFGTVWGIMNSFRGIASAGSASLAAVAPGIAEALIATAVGLFAAIPAAASYNFFIARIRVFSSSLQKYARDLENKIRAKSWTIEPPGA